MDDIALPEERFTTCSHGKGFWSRTAPFNKFRSNLGGVKIELGSFPVWNVFDKLAYYQPSVLVFIGLRGWILLSVFFNFRFVDFHTDRSHGNPRMV